MKPVTRLIRFALLTAALFSMAVGANAQPGDTAALKARARALIDAQKFTEALPLYETLVKQAPKDAEVRYYLGFSLLGQAANTEDPAERRRLRVRARDSFVLARDLGDKSLLVLGLIEGLPADGADPAGYSDNAEANKLMLQGEAFFTSGQMDEALKAYREALLLDPRCYFAALFAGDVNTQTGEFTKAATWYEKAIAINPNIETAYRYSATPLMKQGKYEQARDRYVDAFIVEPYSRLTLSGMIQWGQITKTGLGHPKVDIPDIQIAPDGKATFATITAGPTVEDGSSAWTSYVTTREMWRLVKFAKEFPGSKIYRHTLKEEAEALRSVVASALKLKPAKLNEQIATLAKMDQDGVLEAFILMALPDNDIALDHRPYLLANRDKLRKYVHSYVIRPRP